MKNLLSVFIFILFGLNVFSQTTVGTPEQLEQLLKTKTCVVYDRMPMRMYNVRIKDIIEQNWDLTEYEFITFEEFEKRRENPEYSFLVIFEVMFNNDKTLDRYNFLSLLLGGDYDRVVEMPDLATVPISYQDVEEDEYLYKIGVLARFIQSHIKLTMKNPDLKDNNIIRYYNKNMHSVKEKTLYLRKDELESKVNTLKKIKKVYPYKVKIATKEEIEEVINNQDPDAVVLHKVGPGSNNRKARVWNVLIGTKDAKLYYFDWHMINKRHPNAFTEKDFKKLARKQLKD